MNDSPVAGIDSGQPDVAIVRASEDCNPHWGPSCCDLWPLMDPRRRWLVRCRVTDAERLASRGRLNVVALRPGQVQWLTVYRWGAEPGPEADEWEARVLRSMGRELGDAHGLEYANALARRLSGFLDEGEAIGLAMWLRGAFPGLLADVRVEEQKGIDSEDVDFAEDQWRLDGEAGYPLDFAATAETWFIEAPRETQPAGGLCG